MVHPELSRLRAAQRRDEDWRRWGPYLSERQWGTVREDYSSDGACWDYFGHDIAPSRAYRWGEDGLLGISDRQCRLCFGLGLWNGKDPLLKERLFGLTGPQGNHGEDVKECYYYLDGLPTHAYMKGLYKYPQQAFPYKRLIEENAARGKNDGEFELADTGIFDQNKYFDVQIEYAKHTPNDLLIQFTIFNRSSRRTMLHFLPMLWFRNTWSWGRTGDGYGPKPRIVSLSPAAIMAEHEELGTFHLAASVGPGGQRPVQLFTENETNFAKVFDGQNVSPYTKDAFHTYVVGKQRDAVNPMYKGTKAGFYYRLVVSPDRPCHIRLRLYDQNQTPKQHFGKQFNRVLGDRRDEADRFYAIACPTKWPQEDRQIARQAYAGLLWSKQFYYYSVQHWLEGDPTQPTPAKSRQSVRNEQWKHLHNRNVISMPDKWEYPWYAAWDLAFHMLPFARIDPDFAKEQLILLLREWYMHPNGQIPAYEFSFSDVNPPVHAWACWRVYKMSAPKGQRDRVFLARVFQKLLLNFTWWVNRKDIGGKNLFSGGFLGLDNIGIFDRSRPMPEGGRLEQADATAWMAFYCGTMLSMALELAQEDPAYEDLASKFFEHFVAITDAINTHGGSGLWDPTDHFYYDRLHVKDEAIPLRIRSLVGIIPLIAVEVLDDAVVDRLPGFKRRMMWFIKNRPDLARHITYMNHGTGGSRLLAVPPAQRLVRMLAPILDEREFLSPYGIRSLSKIHQDHPVNLSIGDDNYSIGYEPGESCTNLFGGNSNWRGPVWFPVNFLLIEALERYHHFYGDKIDIEYPTGSGHRMNLKQVSVELTRRLVKIFQCNEEQMRPYQGTDARFNSDENWRDLILFYEHFHGDTGRGLGASHQTGWTALVALCLEKLHDNEAA